jgi:hypothetical protein
MKSYSQVVIECKHCNNKTSHNIAGICGDLSTEKQVVGSQSHYIYEGKLWALLQCQTCRMPSLVEGIGHFRTRDPLERLITPDYGSGSIDLFDNRGYESFNPTRMLENTSLKMMYPINAAVAMPSPDMPPDVASDYLEARAIFEASPRSSSALLRLAIQKLCKHLGQPGKNINDDIGALVKAGLPVEIQQALDYVRVIGNNAVHPGNLNVADNPDIARALFELINIIIEVMITRPRKIQSLYNSLPSGVLQAIQKRDTKTP